MLILGFLGGGPTNIRSNYLLIKGIDAIGVRIGGLNEADPDVGDRQHEGADRPRRAGQAEAAHFAPVPARAGGRSDAGGDRSQGDRQGGACGVSSDGLCLPATNEPPHPVLQPNGIEVQQQSHLTAAHPQVRQQLRFMRRHQPFDRLDLNNKVIGNQEVSAKPRVEEDVTIPDRNCRLAPKRNASQFQLKAKAGL